MQDCEGKLNTFLLNYFTYFDLPKKYLSKLKNSLTNIVKVTCSFLIKSSIPIFINEEK